MPDKVIPEVNWEANNNSLEMVTVGKRVEKQYWL